MEPRGRSLDGLGDRVEPLGDATRVVDVGRAAAVVLAAVRDERDALRERHLRDRVGGRWRSIGAADGRPGAASGASSITDAASSTPLGRHRRRLHHHLLELLGHRIVHLVVSPLRSLRSRPPHSWPRPERRSRGARSAGPARSSSAVRLPRPRHPTPRSLSASVGSFAIGAPPAASASAIGSRPRTGRTNCSSTSSSPSSRSSSSSIERVPLSRRRSNETSSTSVRRRAVAGREVPPPSVVGDGHDDGVVVAARLEAAQEVPATLGQRMPRRRDRRHVDPPRVRADHGPRRRDRRPRCELRRRRAEPGHVLVVGGLVNRAPRGRCRQGGRGSGGPGGGGRTVQERMRRGWDDPRTPMVRRRLAVDVAVWCVARRRHGRIRMQRRRVRARRGCAAGYGALGRCRGGAESRFRTDWSARCAGRGGRST